MNLTVGLSVFSAIAVFIGIVVGIIQARQSIRDGRIQQANHDKEVRGDGFDAGVASCQAQILDLKNQVIQLTDDRNYWRGRNGGGRDDRRDDDDRR